VTHSGGRGGRGNVRFRTLEAKNQVNRIFLRREIKVVRYYTKDVRLYAVYTVTCSGVFYTEKSVNFIYAFQRLTVLPLGGAHNRSEWRRSVAQCIHLDAG